jgi:peptide subunit release factor 1 (eRF1)
MEENMLNESDLRELLDFCTPNLVLSVYLNTDPADGNVDTYKLRLRNLLKEVNLPQDASAVEHYFTADYHWSGRGAVVFSSAAENFFKAYPLSVKFRSLVHVGERPLVKPLKDLLDSYGGYGVVLVDKQGARLFHFNMGMLTEQEGVLGETVKHVKRGGASSVHGRQGGVAGRTDHMEETIERNMKDACEFAVRFFEENHVRRVLIGGTDDNVAILRGMLPKAWQSLVMGSFPMSMTATHTEVQARAMQIGTEAELRRTQRLVDDLITIAAKGKGAVVGLEKTLDAINNNKVQTLVVEEGFRSGGSECQGYGHLTIKDGEVCPVCGGQLVSAGVDVVDLAVSTVMRHRGDVEVIPSNLILEKAGHMGAVLRY